MGFTLMIYLGKNSRNKRLITFLPGKITELRTLQLRAAEHRE